MPYTLAGPARPARVAKRPQTMLILTRRVGEVLMIGDEVAVTVLSIKGNQVRIGVRAPKHVTVHREEIYERIHGGQDKEVPDEKA